MAKGKQQQKERTRRFREAVRKEYHRLDKEENMKACRIIKILAEKFDRSYDTIEDIIYRKKQ